MGVHKVGQKLSPKEQFKNLPIDLTRTATDYWQWGFSAVLSNTDRGVLAEYIVAILLGIDSQARIPWDAADLTLPSGHKIEVKSTAMLQAWSQGILNEPRIALKPTVAYNPDTKTYGKPDFNADIYVFCYFTAQKLDTANLLDLDQWRFYCFSRQKIMEILDGRKSISLKQLDQQGAKQLTASQVSEAVGRIVTP